MPRSTFAPTIHAHDGPYASMNGTGRPTIQPATSTVFLVYRSASQPDTRLTQALIRPNVMMNEKTTISEPIPNSLVPISGTTVRSRPTMPPTKALMRTRSENCGRFSRSPSRRVSGVACMLSGLQRVHVHAPDTVLARDTLF
jgi:hypothetical protein